MHMFPLESFSVLKLSDILIAFQDEDEKLAKS